MLKNIKNVLLYNSGGGLGDSLLMIPIIQWLRDYYQLSRIHYIQNGIQKHFETSLKDFYDGFVHTINFLPENYAFFKLTRASLYFPCLLKINPILLYAVKSLEFFLKQY